MDLRIGAISRNPGTWACDQVGCVFVTSEDSLPGSRVDSRSWRAGAASWEKSKPRVNFEYPALEKEAYRHIGERSRDESNTHEDEVSA